MEELMLFPLQSVLFPGSTASLHIFEPRYRAMVRICLRELRPFGVVLIKTGGEVGGTAVPHDVGTEATIIAWQETADGRYNLVAQGGRRFRIEELDHSRPYLVGRVTWFDDLSGELSPEGRAALLETFTGPRNQDLLPGRVPNPDALETASDPELTFALADAVPAPPATKQRLLESRNAAERSAMLLELLGPIGAREEKARAAR